MSKLFYSLTFSLIVLTASRASASFYDWQALGKNFKLGSPTTVDKLLVFDINAGGSNPCFKANSVTGHLQLANNCSGAFTDVGSGTVTSVGLSVPPFLSVSGSPVTTSGSLAVTLSGTALPVANGGTGQTSVTAAFNSLNPMATTGDLIYESGTNTASRLPVGSSGNVLTVTGGVPVWAPPAGGTGTVTSVGLTDSTGLFTVTGSPVTTSGSINLSAFANQTQKTFLAAPNGSTGPPNFRTIAASDVPTLNQNTTGTSSNVTGVVALINGGTGTAAASANAAFNALSPMTTGGDLIYGGAAGVATRLTNGSAGQVLTSNGTTLAPSWGMASGSVARNIVSKTSAYTAIINDYILASSSSFNITLPTAVGVSGQTIVIQHNGTNFSQVYTLLTTSSQTVGGFTSGSYSLYTNGETLELASDGANWQVLNHNAVTGEINTGVTGITATTTNPVKGTTSVDQVWLKRNGSRAEIRIEYRQTAIGSGTAGSGDYLFAMPSNVGIDVASLTAYTTVVGWAAQVNAPNSVGTCFLSSNITTNNNATGSVIVYDGSRVRFSISLTTTAGNSGTGMLSSGSPITLSGGIVTITATFSVPIAGWRP